ncbi:hypothetical protein [Polyangium sp. y55x31]|uniref:hypothetical protein n=1 Tax=Polyangium sp. y55x31 TaxID=3042688 RepID=UPI002482F999|nr:hypothetical protein [Polyangium sp. y55x31]MDI1480132.1 hypothetical protein [Polyangium sp. y55x31]
MKTLVGWLVLGSVIGGCAAPPPPQVPSDFEYQLPHRSTGETLRIETKDSTRTVMKKIPVGERQVYTASGRYVGKEVVYEAQPTEVPVHEWHVYQGDTEVDALSALHIARYAAFERAYQDERDRVQRDHARALEMYETEVKGAQTMKNVGLGMGIGGLAGMVGAGGLFLATRNDETPPVPTSVTGAVSLGFMALAIGGFYLRAKASREQAAAVIAAERLAASRMENKFQRFATEEHVRNAVGSPKPAAGAATAEASAPTVRLSATLDPSLATGIPNNEKLGPALIAIWTPEAYGMDGEKAHENFDRELLRSVLYFNNARGTMPKHEGNLVFYTDEASLRAVDGEGAKPEGMPAMKVLTLALATRVGVYVHHEGKASVFTVLDEERIKQLLLLATDKASGR